MEPEFDDVVSVEDLMALERRYAAESRSGAPSRGCSFEYAWGLVRSPYGADVAKGLALLRELMADGTPEEKRDYVYYLAVGNYRLKEYERALGYVGALLQAEPQNSQGLRLQRLIRARMHRDGLLGAAIVGGVALGVAGLAGLLGLAISRARH
ncbi:mitochondrial fission 1 protein isoform X1 [Cygnus atratus]|uniref:mitochondrial fission 1 protein isoform X1 n=1 Tax=Cygnus atratus TaxID=8868 RepID=UPI0015D59C4C|nr:mitochondrial fission 1 protein isoform X1 [Cygnus atratus]